MDIIIDLDNQPSYGERTVKLTQADIDAIPALIALGMAKTPNGTFRVVVVPKMSKKESVLLHRREQASASVAYVEVVEGKVAEVSQDYYRLGFNPVPGTRVEFEAEPYAAFLPK